MKSSRLPLHYHRLDLIWNNKSNNGMADVCNIVLWTIIARFILLHHAVVFSLHTAEQSRIDNEVTDFDPAVAGGFSCCYKQRLLRCSCNAVQLRVGNGVLARMYLSLQQPTIGVTASMEGWMNVCIICTCAVILVVQDRSCIHTYIHTYQEVAFEVVSNTKQSIRPC